LGRLDRRTRGNRPKDRDACASIHWLDPSGSAASFDKEAFAQKGGDVRLRAVWA